MPFSRCSDWMNSRMPFCRSVSMFYECPTPSGLQVQMNTVGLLRLMQRELKRYFVELSGPAAQISEGKIEIRKRWQFLEWVRGPARISDPQLSQRSVG